MSQQILQSLQEKCIFLHSLRDNAILFKELNALPKDRLNVIIRKYEFEGRLQPVNLLRFLVAQALLSGTVVDEVYLNRLKDAIQARDISSLYNASAELANSLRNYKQSDKGMFPQWKSPFSVLYQFFYTKEEKQQTLQGLRSIGDAIVLKYSLDEAHVHVVGFDGPQNYGVDSAWGAVIPDVSSDVKESYQLFYRISTEGIEAGLYKGHNVKDSSFENRRVPCRDFESFLNQFKKWIDDWKKLNENVEVEISPTEIEELLRQELQVEMKHPLNQILYGPPGTGKTYSSIVYALSIIENKSIELINLEKRTEVKKRYDDYVEEGRIAFITFHQSLSYEDFIEGIKPDAIESSDWDDLSQPTLTYSVRPGIFKQLCSEARFTPTVNNKVAWEKAKFYKMSLGGKQNLPMHEWCIANNYIGLGWGGSEDLSEFASVKDWESFRNKFKIKYPDLVSTSKFHIQAAYSFLKMQKGDVVVVSRGNHIIDAVGVVKGPYQWDDSNPFAFHLRAVEWLATNLAATPSRFYAKNVSQQAIYELNLQDVKIDSFKELTRVEPNKKKPYVLIIDEINRGNVSQIFGELITLVEEGKREGKTEALKAKLPYSNVDFSVPENVYIIGTMNTADRSVEALDTALRRRFSFTELMPKPELLEQTIGGIQLSKLLSTINERIEALLDRDHTIGHSFFYQLKSDDREGLRDVFRDSLIPLLKEYFYGDYGKIALVLGKGFVAVEKNPAKVKFAIENKDYEGSGDFTSPKYTVLEIDNDFDIVSAIKQLMLIPVTSLVPDPIKN